MFMSTPNETRRIISINSDSKSEVNVNILGSLFMKAKDLNFMKKKSLRLGT